jgi:hypothetical protein
MTDTVSKFENIIGALKAPILDSTDKTMANNNSGQDVETVLGAVGGRMDEIHKALTNAINNTQVAGGEAGPSINNLLEQNGILPALRADPSLKESLIAAANRHLKEYPYSRNVNHANNLKNTATPSNTNIIPNK